MSPSLFKGPKGCASAQPQAGFTLIEVMITMVIVAILASVAYPSYIEYVARGHRTQLKAQMQAAQQWMERRYSERYVYDDAPIPANAANGFANQAFATSPPSGEGAARYELKIDLDADKSGYTLVAKRVGTMAKDQCGNPTVDNHGVKGVVESSLSDGKYEGAVSKAVEACWR